MTYVPRSCKFNVVIRSKFKGRMFTTIEAAEQCELSLGYVRELLCELLHFKQVELVQEGSIARYSIWRVVP